MATHREFLDMLSRMTPTEKMQQVAEMNAFERAQLRVELRDRYPCVSEQTLREILLAELAARNARTGREELAIAARLHDEGQPL